MKKEIAIPVFVLAIIVSIVFIVSSTTCLRGRFFERHYSQDRFEEIEKVSETSKVTAPGKEKITLLVSKIFIGVENLEESQYSAQLTWENGNATESFFHSKGFIAFKIPGHPLIFPEVSIIFRNGRQKIVPLEINNN